VQIYSKNPLTFTKRLTRTLTSVDRDLRHKTTHTHRQRSYICTKDTQKVAQTQKNSAQTAPELPLLPDIQLLCTLLFTSLVDACWCDEFLKSHWTHMWWVIVPDGMYEWPLRLVWHTVTTASAWAERAYIALGCNNDGRGQFLRSKVQGHSGT